MVATVANTCNFCIMGAGYQSSQLVWYPVSGQTVNTTAMLQLCSAAIVTIKDIGFTIASGASIIPTYGVQIRNSLTSPGEAPSEVRLKRVFVGGNSTQYMNTAIAYTADVGCDGSGEHGTFHDVDIQYAATGYGFGTSQGLNNAIIGGSVQNCTSAAISNVAIRPCVNGGNFHVYGTRFAGNALTFQIVGDYDISNSIALVGISAGTAANPEGALLHYTQTESGPQQQEVVFIGGRAILSDPGSGNSVYYQAGSGNIRCGSLDFHNFRMTSPTGVALNFPDTGSVTFMGGKIYTKSCYYAGSLHYHGTIEMGTPTFTSSGGPLAHLVQIGCNNHLAGTSAVFPSGNVINPGAAGPAGTVSAVGDDLGGLLTVVTDPTTTYAGNIVELAFWLEFPTPPLVLLSPANAAAAAVMSTVFSTPSSNSQNAFFVTCSTKLPTGTTFLWNYMIMG